MSHLPLDLKFLILDYIAPLKLVELLQQLNVNYLNQHYYNLLAVPRIIRLPFTIVDNNILFNRMTSTLSEFNNVIKTYLNNQSSNMDFDEWSKFTNLNDGDVVIVSSGSRGIPWVITFISTFIKVLLLDCMSYLGIIVNLLINLLYPLKLWLYLVNMMLVLLLI